MVRPVEEDEEVGNDEEGEAIKREWKPRRKQHEEQREIQASADRIVDNFLFSFSMCREREKMEEQKKSERK
jgi:hypothetical protein